MKLFAQKRTDRPAPTPAPVTKAPPGLDPVPIADLNAEALRLNAELADLGGTPTEGIGRTLQTVRGHVEVAALALKVRKAREAKAAKQGTAPPTDLAALAAEIRTRLAVVPAAATAPAAPPADEPPTEHEIDRAQSQLCCRSRTLAKALATERRRKRQ